LLLLPFHFKTKEPHRYKGIWKFIGELLRTRFNACLGLNFLIGHHFNTVIGLITGKPAVGYASMVIYLVVVTPAVFWYPFSVRDSKQGFFRGLVKVIADWLQET